MPELPEVETIARKLSPYLVGHTFTDVEVLWPRTIDRPGLDKFKAAITGAQVIEVTRRGKYLMFKLDTPYTLLVHLRMSGKFFLHPTKHLDDPHIRVRLKTDDGHWLIFSDTRKFGRFYLVDNVEEVIDNLGPEPLDPAFTVAMLSQRLEGRRGELKRLLLNQGFIAGLGNIYASEILWRARLHPQRVAGSLTHEEIQRLHEAIKAVLQQSIADGGTSLDDRQYVYPDGGLGRHQTQLMVYDRAEETCPRCGYAIVRIVQGQRSTYFCPVCQRKRSANLVKNEEDSNE
jgi:formamidopyrimidine-DNA glycosylase